MINNKKLFSTFFKTLFLSMGIFALLALGLYFGYAYFTKGSQTTADSEGAIRPGLKKGGNMFAGMFEAAPERVNFLVLGTDEDGTRTDVMLVGSFLPKDGQVSLVSIPRDTFVTMPEDRLNIVKGYNPYVRSDGVMKLNEVHHHAGKENGIDYTVKQIEELLNIDLQYYGEINLEGFRYLVDAVGGVEFDVPQRMYYNDPYQNLLIDLQPGVQMLDGKAAEGLVRYRYGYANSDFDRMGTQQRFLKAMAAQTLSSENVVKNIPSIITTGMKYFKTNFNVADVPKYLKYLKNFSSENMATYTLPSSSKKINGKDFQVLDEEGTKEIIQKAFYDPFEPEKIDTASTGKSIQVLNGGYTEGLAGKTKDRLSAEGFTVDAIADYMGEKQAMTRIIVKKEGQGEDLSTYFQDSEIEVNPGYTADYDIVIVLGTLEK